jgi:hypothetical protein
VRGYLGNQGRNRPNKRGRGGPDGNRGPRQDELPPDAHKTGLGSILKTKNFLIFFFSYLIL